MQVSAVILSGGRSRRFGGVHKPGVNLAGQSVLSRIVQAVREALPESHIWITGSLEGLSADEVATVNNVREEPRFSGPLAGIDAAVNAIAESEVDIILIVAGDMPLIGSAHLRDLVAAASVSGAPAAGRDDRGKVQFLCAAWPAELLRARLEELGEVADRPVKLLFRDTTLTVVDVDLHVLKDFDTAAELDEIRARLE